VTTPEPRRRRERGACAERASRLLCALCASAALELAVALSAPAPPALAADAPAIATPGALPAPDAPYAAALAPLGLAPADLRVDADTVAVFGQDRHRLPLLDLLLRDARRAPGVAEALRDHALETAALPSEAVLFTMSRVQARVRRALVSDPIADLAARAAPPGALAEAVALLREAAGAGPTPPEALFALRRSAAEVPPKVAEAAALILLAEARFLGWRERALAPLSEREREALLLASGMLVSADAGSGAYAALDGAAAKVDLSALAAGAFDAVLALERALPALVSASADLRLGRAPPFRFRVETPIGAVEVDGRLEGTTRTADDAHVLLVELAGDDRYEAAGAARGRATPVAIAVDLHGNDAYDTRDPGLGHTFGAGILGLGVLLDAAGDDAYRAGPFALGAGFLGIGILHDAAGDDRYEGETFVEGAALLGAGALVDAAGNDRYLCLDRSQGFGGVLGAGLLCDAAGDDAYTADDRRLVRPSAQTGEHNSSLSQGAATGIRLDYVDGRSLAGGFGMLADGGGDDVYAAGVFAQGVGYWFGTGVLADRGGNDSYEGVWYVQGAGAHFGAGILHDAAGSDRYRARVHASQGLGHDFSLGFLYDAAGDDDYEAPSLSLGAGNACGVGILVDRGGRDRYALAPGADARSVLGHARTAPSKPYDLRRRGGTIGLFLDLGGAEDAYPEGRGANGAAWHDPPEGDVPDDLSARGARAAGMDR
jgi:hypothetical protein